MPNVILVQRKLYRYEKKTGHVGHEKKKNKWTKVVNRTFKPKEGGHAWGPHVQTIVHSADDSYCVWGEGERLWLQWTAGSEGPFFESMTLSGYVAKISVLRVLDFQVPGWRPTVL